MLYVAATEIGQFARKETSAIPIPALTRDQAKKKANYIADNEGTNPVYHDRKGKFSKS